MFVSERVCGRWVGRGRKRGQKREAWGVRCKRAKRGRMRYVYIYIHTHTHTHMYEKMDGPARG